MNDGAKLKATIVYMREFCQQLALLLRTSDALMADRTFEQAGGNYAIIETSGVIGQPTRWIPNEVFRFYWSGEHPRVLAFVAALLDDRDKRYATELHEPLLTAGAFIYQSKPGNNWEWWWARWHGKMRNRRDDGTMVQVDAASWPGEKFPFERVMTLAVPLIEVVDSTSLSQRLIEPLSAAVAEFREASGPATEVAAPPPPLPNG